MKNIPALNLKPQTQKTKTTVSPEHRRPGFLFKQAGYMTIRLKLVLLLVMFAMLSAGMIGWHIYGHLSEVEENAVRDAESSAQAFAVSLSFVDKTTDIPPIYKSPSRLREFIYDRKRLLADVEDFVVVDVNRIIIGDAVSEEVGKSYDEEHKGREVELTIKDGVTRTFIEKNAGHPDGVRQLVVPLKTEEGETVGAVILEYTAYYNKYSALIKKEIRIILIFGALIFLISLGIAYYLADGIAGNIARLKKATEAMAAGDLETKAEVGSRDELGDLARSFNKMAELREAAEEELRKKEKEFRTLTDNSQEVIQRFDRQLNRLYVNPVIEKCTGIPYKEFIGKTDRELGLPEQNIALWEKAAQTLLETGKEQTVEFDFSTPQGNTYFETHLMPEFGTDGKVVSILVITRDITVRRKAESELRDNELRYGSLFEGTSNAVMIFDAETLQFEDANQKTLRLLGYSKEEFMNLKVSDISAEKEETTVAVQKVKNETPDSGYIPLRHFVKKDGTVFPGEIFPGTFMFKGRKKIIGVVNDITARIKNEEALEKAHEELVEKTAYLERFNRIMVGREIEMINLKAEVNELLEKTGQPKKYEAPAEAEGL